MKTCNHKVLSLYYLAFAIISLIAGVIFSLIIKIELYESGNRIISSDNLNYYNLDITLHGLIMIFFVLMPGLFGGLGNYLVPIYVGSPEIIFPRLNNCSVVFTSLSLVIMLLALLTEYSIGPGWTVYPPLSLYPVNTTVLVILGLTVSGLGTLITSINYILTAFHTLILADLFVPAMVITSVMLVFVLPVLTGALLLIISDMYFNTIFWKGIINGNSGDPVLYQHLFWFFGQTSIWPVYTVKYIMYDAVCWNFMLEYSIHIIISCITIYYIISLFITIKFNTMSFLVVLVLVAHIVTTLVMMNNQQVTNGLYYLVGTSETLRIVSFFLTIIPMPPQTTSKKSTLHNHNDIDNENKIFNEWLAGIVDGDGSLLVSKSGYSSCEITMHKYDYPTLMSIKNKLGGSVKLRSGVNAYRYRLHHRDGMVDLINRINGNIRNSQRIPALIKVCTVLNINYIPALPLTLTNAWYSGFFDADGTITAKFHTPSPTITISVSNKHRIDVEPFLLFNGHIYYSKGLYGHYVWQISSQSDILNMLDYFKIHPSRSHKLARLSFINQFYTLRYLKAHKDLDNISLSNRWNTLRSKWSKWDS